MKITLLHVGFVALNCVLACPETLPAYDWLPPTNKVTVLAVDAHPDDEGIFFGGALPYYSSVLRLPAILICMTAGTDSVRDEELRCAAWTYGLRQEPLYGHFRDVNSGQMTNTAYGTNTINITWDLWADGVLQGDGSDVEAGKARAINYVAEQIRRYRPDVILTMDVNGESGHDNHKAASYAATRAYFVAADPNATAPNLVGLPPWQTRKLYVHLYSANRLFHPGWETAYPSLSGQTPHQAVNHGLACHVSQGPSRWICASVYPPAGSYTFWPSEWWGLYASAVGPDTPAGNSQVLNGYPVPGGVAVGDFLEHLNLSTLFFTTVPASTNAPAGTSVTLTAAATASTLPPVYQWQFNGASIAGATESTLKLGNLQTADSGTYSVSVFSSGNSLTSPPAVLNVLVPPTITTTPQTRTNLAGTVATFIAMASGSGPLGYQWLLNGITLQDGPNVHGATADSLEIANVQPADAGSLILKVSNPAGVTAAPVGTLVVEMPPPCAGVTPDVVGWWPGDGNPSDVAGSNSGTLVGGASAGAAGKVGQAFSFDGVNSSVRVPDSPQLRPANLTVEAWVLFNGLDSSGSGGSPPGQQYLVFKRNSRTSYFEGYSLTKTRSGGRDLFAFTASSAAGQTASVQSTTVLGTGVWYHVAAVRGADFIQLYVNGQLEDQAVVSFPQDYGSDSLFFGSSGQSYWDHKLNGLLDEVAIYRRALSGAEIAAIYTAGAAGKCQEAAVTISPADQTAVIGSNVTLAATASGPALSYQWLFNRTNALAGATNSTLPLSNLTLSQSGSYSVLVSNLAGAVLSQPVALRVTPPAGIVMPVRLSGAVGSTWRIDYVNELRPSNNWTSLATVVLTNASQVYFDSSALTQRHRFYRVVPLP